MQLGWLHALRELLSLVPGDVHNGFPGTLVLWVEQIDLADSETE
jgi:hypothetical protein